jgi:hypothetical protein
MTLFRCVLSKMDEGNTKHSRKAILATTVSFNHTYQANLSKHNKYVANQESQDSTNLNTSSLSAIALKFLDRAKYVKWVTQHHNYGSNKPGG